MSKNILDSAVESKLPASKKSRPSKLEEISRQRNQEKAALKPQIKKTTPPTKLKNSTVSFLLLDSDNASRHGIRNIGRNLNFNVYTTNSFTQALRTLDVRNDIGIVLLNFDGYPDMGEKALKILKERHPTTSIIGLASMSNAGWIIDLVSKGHAFRYLPEPFSHSEFEQVILSAQKRHQMLTRMDNLRQKVSSDRGVVNAINKIKLLFG